MSFTNLRSQGTSEYRILFDGDCDLPNDFDIPAQVGTSSDLLFIGTIAETQTLDFLFVEVIGARTAGNGQIGIMFAQEAPDNTLLWTGEVILGTWDAATTYMRATLRTNNQGTLSAVTQSPSSLNLIPRNGEVIDGVPVQVLGNIGSYEINQQRFMPYTVGKTWMFFYNNGQNSTQWTAQYRISGRFLDL